METETIIIISVFSAAWAALFVMAAVLCARVASLRAALAEMQATGRMRVQKLKMENDRNHAFHNPGLAPEEELSRRGYSIYMPEDVESGRGVTERQTGGQFVEELTREIDSRQQRHASPPFHELNQFYHQERDRDTRHLDRQEARHETRHDTRHDSRHDTRHSTAPPFLLQAIEENKKKSRLANPVANGSGRQSDTNPNFIY